MEITTELHNYCEVEVYNNKELVNVGKGYNTSYSEAYNNRCTIEYARIVGKSKNGNSFHQDISIRTPTEEEVLNNNDQTTDWYRGNIPSYENGTDVRRGRLKKTACSEYNCELYCVPIHTGYITKVELYTDNPDGGGVLISSIQVSDIRNKQIYIDVDATSGVSLLIHEHIYFINDFGLVKRERPVNQWRIKDGKEQVSEAQYKFYLFDASFSILGGSCGKHPDILRQNENFTNVPSFLPQVYNTGLAITKSGVPVHFHDEYTEEDFCTGGILEYQMIEHGANQRGTYINKHPANGTWKGLIRALLMPYVGVIELPNIGIFKPKNVCLNENLVTPNNIANYNKNNKVFDMVPCYIPRSYITGGNTQNLMSMAYNGLAGAKINVLRFYEATEDKWRTHDKASKTKAFFSDLDKNAKTRRCQGFSHPIPLTENQYCGAETIIPCAPSPQIISSDPTKENFYGYYGYCIDYSIPINGDTKNKDKGYRLDYAVTGQYLYEIIETGLFALGVFPYILEYSYDGNIFTEACSFDENSRPYWRYEFSRSPEGDPPIWRIRSNVMGKLMYNAGTTHSDPYIAEVAGNNINGYDPYFIFVGYTKDENFVYDSDPHSENVMAARGDFKVTVPYLCHSNDNFYVTGLTVGERH